MRSIPFVLAALAGCGGGSLTDLEGVYTVSAWTTNPAGCAAEGPSVAEQRDPLFYLKGESFLGVEFVNIKGCQTEADCKMLAGEADTIHIGEFSFDEGSDSAGWTSRSAFGFENGGECTGSVTESIMTSPADGQIRIEVRTTDAAPFAPDGQGECADEAVEAAAAGQPCSELEVVTGAHLSGL
jgi:hypothetical protein